MRPAAPSRGDPRAAWLLALGLSGALLAGALGFEHLAGLPPCPMCHWQRWAHLGVVTLAGLALVVWSAGRPAGARVLGLGALVALAVAAGVALLHAGVEAGWWPSPVGCAGAPAAASADDLLAQLWSAPLVRCDAVPWSFAGLSMAGWNALLSAAGVMAVAGMWRRA